MANQVLGLISCNYNNQSYNNDSFGKLTAERPLAAMPFGGRYRLLDFALSNMVNSGLRTIGLITPYYYRSILDHVGSGKEWSLNRKSGGLFILPGSIYGLKNSQGTFLLRDIIQNRPYLERSDAELVLLSGSTKIYNMDLRPFLAAHRASGNAITMAYKLTPESEQRSGTYLELTEGRVTDTRQDAAGTAACSLDCLLIQRKLLLDFIEGYQALNYIDVLEIIRQNLATIQVGGYEFSGWLGQVDTIGDYMRCSQALLDEDVRRELFSGGAKVYTKIQDSPPAKYCAGAEVKNSLVPTGCIIRGKVENSVLFRGVEIGKGAVVKNCVIMQKCRIQPGAVLENVICDKFVTIGSGNKLFGTLAKPMVIAKNSEI